MNLCLLILNYRNAELAADDYLKDYGRMKITHDLNDSLKFKVPTLRNAQVTLPYGHDGRFNSLLEVSATSECLLMVENEKTIFLVCNIINQTPIIFMCRQNWGEDLIPVNQYSESCIAKR